MVAVANIAMIGCQGHDMALTLSDGVWNLPAESFPQMFHANARAQPAAKHLPLAPHQHHSSEAI
eukprot:12938875-Prorocentrum_lima.AAC.1